MQYSGNQGSAFTGGRAPLIKGGGIIPPILLEESRVPRFYKDAIASCGAANPSQLPNTTCVYNLMVASGLPRSMLSYIWTIVNRTLPGQLTRQEFYSCLALIALAQKGQTLCALSFVTTLPVPQLQLQQLTTKQNVQGQQLIKNAAVAQCSSVQHCNNMMLPNHLQRTAIFPTSISVQSFGQHQFPSAAESAALCFTKSLDVRNSQRAALKKMSNNDVSSDFCDKTPKLIKTSQSFPTDVVALTTKVETPIKNIPSYIVTGTGLSSQKKQEFVKNAPIFNDTSMSNLNLAGLRKSDAKILNSRIAPSNSLDLLLNLPVPSTSSSLKESDSCNESEFTSNSVITFAEKSISKHSIEKQAAEDSGFGVFPNFVEADDRTDKASNSSKIKQSDPSGSSNGKTDSFDIYAAVKMVEGDDVACEGKERIVVWHRCIDEAQKIFEAGENLLSSYSRQMVEIVAQTEKGSRYFTALKNIFEMVGRITSGRTDELSEKKEALKEINLLWEHFKVYICSPQNSSDGIANGLLVKRCCICLTEISEESLLEFAGNDYHKHCANFWTNRVNSVLPKLS